MANINKIPQLTGFATNAIGWTPQLNVHIGTNGGFGYGFTIHESVGPHTLTVNSPIVNLVDNDGVVNMVFNLPQCSTCIGRIFVFKKITNDSNTTTIDPYLSETIDGELTHVLSTQYSSVTIMSDGNNWHII